MAKASTLPTISPDSWIPSEDHPDSRSRNVPKIPWEDEVGEVEEEKEEREEKEEGEREEKEEGEVEEERGEEEVHRSTDYIVYSHQIIAFTLHRGVSSLSFGSLSSPRKSSLQQCSP